MVDALDAQSAAITRELRLYARRQPGCRALMGHYGIGELTAVTILPSRALPLNLRPTGGMTYADIRISRRTSSRRREVSIALGAALEARARRARGRPARRRSSGRRRRHCTPRAVAPTSRLRPSARRSGRALRDTRILEQEPVGVVGE